MKPRLSPGFVTEWLNMTRLSAHDLSAAPEVKEAVGCLKPPLLSFGVFESTRAAQWGQNTANGCAGQACQPARYHNPSNPPCRCHHTTQSYPCNRTAEPTTLVRTTCSSHVRGSNQFRQRLCDSQQHSVPHAKESWNGSHCTKRTLRTACVTADNPHKTAVELQLATGQRKLYETESSSSSLGSIRAKPGQPDQNKKNQDETPLSWAPAATERGGYPGAPAQSTHSTVITVQALRGLSATPIRLSEALQSRL